jgi:predicted permease
MLKNYFKTAFRNLVREKASTVINLAGLTLGISCSLILFLLISEINSFDNFHSKRDRIFRVVNQSEGNHGTEYQSGVPSVLPDAFRTDFPEAEQVVFTSYRANSLVTIPQRTGEAKKYREEAGIVFTEPSFFKIFDRRVISGDVQKGLDEPNEAVISSGLAMKYFGKADAIGEVLKFDTREYRITAIIEDAPENTDLPFNLMLSYSTIKQKTEEHGWNSTWSDEQCYFLLKENETIASVESRLPAFTKKYLGDDDPDKTQYFTQSLLDLHFDERFETYSYNTSSRGMLIALGIMGLILVVTACINFINLSTAEAIKRSKEVGIRKSLGSSKKQLVFQFLGETTLVTLLAVIMALALTQFGLTFINPFLNKHLSLDLASNYSLWAFLISVTTVVSLLSGLYPAFVLSRFNPVVALKNQITNKTASGFTLRRALVVVQFGISQFFIIATIIVVNQMKFFQQKDLGYVKDAILLAPIPESEEPATEQSGTSKMRTLRDEMTRVPGVENVSLSSAPPSSGNVSSTIFVLQGSDETHSTQMKLIDDNYLELYKLELINGQNVQDLDTANGFLVNEKLARVAGFDNPADIIGKVIRVSQKELPVVGVVKDFHAVSLRDPIEATVLFNRIRSYKTLALKVNLNQTPEILEQLKSKWEATYPEYLFEYHFLDDNIREFYDGVEKMSIVSTFFSMMAIFIGCLGLFGLATFMVNQKTKEIGVRKVLGATVESIVMMFSKEYVRLILFGFLIGAPLAWLAMNKFLEEFAYKISIGPGIFVVALLSTLALAMLTVGFKSLRAAMTNPVNSLRSE